VIRQKGKRIIGGKRRIFFVMVFSAREKEPADGTERKQEGNGLK